jgi:hypothetical protein
MPAAVWCKYSDVTIAKTKTNKIVTTLSNKTNMHFFNLGILLVTSDTFTSVDTTSRDNFSHITPLPAERGENEVWKGIANSTVA